MDITKIVEQVLGGEISPLDTYIELKTLEKEIADALTKIKDDALLEAQKYNGADYKGFRIEVRDGGGRYSYDHIDDYKQLKEQLKSLESKYQSAYKQSLKSISLIDDNGEEVPVARYTFSSPSILFK